MCGQICKFSTFEFPKIKTDFITSIGSMCRVAHHLRKNHLRNLASPLDWMINDKLEVVFELFKSDFKDFFLSCSFVKNADDFIGKADVYRQVVRDDSNDMVAIHYFYSYEDLKTQSERINKQARKRWVLIKDKICSSKNVVFMRSGEFDLETSKEFLHNVSKLFGNTGGGGLHPHQCQP
ncbi:hypothetical protein FBG06_04770 [Campylobacter upsaliensis]|uniref:DUF1796 family putative cysteine peptidase n=1 Tax=Campylobacter upsaliensis TaxID=28080 RepID=UPI00128A38B1|nr:DUF1796 family putative cysteine peptidase [Campylobacter upsaliensis]EAJ7389160.1 hypothetical protein [Campylobacter upsaliensis]EAJ9383364.1 hypothetical protein [Campylobacter upsaliensis]EAL3903432.1 hypothetical protein [Campylobacter upsaliensis]EDP6825269.1 hypothetical protein [Campylobacter upsaliensis]EGR6366347.1 hypothetical protein [Campylobacter upsaliensis]